MPVIYALEKLRQENHGFKGRLGYTARPSQKRGWDWRQGLLISSRGTCLACVKALDWIQSSILKEKKNLNTSPKKIIGFIA